MSPDLMRRLLIAASMLLPFAIPGCQTTAMLSIPGEARSESADDILRRLREDEGLPAHRPRRRHDRRGVRHLRVHRVGPGVEADV